MYGEQHHGLNVELGSVHRLLGALVLSHLLVFLARRLGVLGRLPEALRHLDPRRVGPDLLPIGHTDQLDVAVGILTNQPFVHPAAHELGCTGVVGLLLLEAIETLLELDDLLRLPVEACLTEGLLFSLLKDLDLGPTALRARLEQVLGGAFRHYK